MDPFTVLGITASIIACLQLTGALIKRAKSSDHSRKDLNHILKVICGFKGAYEALELHLKYSEEDSSRLSAFNHLNEPLVDCKAALELLEKRLRDMNFIGQYLIGGQWDRKLNKCLQRLEDAKGLLELALSADHQILLSAIERYVRNAAEDVRDIKATLNESNKRLLDIEDQNQEQHKRLEERHSELKEDLSKVNCAVDGLHRIERNMLDVAEQDRHLSKLSYADGSAYNCYSRQHDPQCLPGTRVDLLNQLVDWGNSPLGKCMFWLNGMAGTGKSTIARTVASTFDSQKRLGGSFFFSRGRGDLSHASKFFSTIAVQLANTTPILKRYICDAIAEHGDISQQTLHNQWSKLILRPLSMLESSLLSPTIIILVVDALDECECQDDIRVILCLFAEAKNLKTARLRIFVTSRPEIQIRLGFGALPGVVHDEIVLHNIAQSIVKQDISVFLKHELEKIREEHALSRDWPGEQTIKVLVERADGLFIYVATICRFVGDPKWLPEERLPLVLQGDSDGQAPTRKLDEMYFQVLRHSVTGDCDEREKPTLSNRFRQVVGTIVTLFESLSVAALTELLAVSARMALVMLNPLSSVLDIPKHQDHPIRLVHPSFRDFLLDKQRCLDDQFWIDERRVHTDLAEHSLRLMSNALRRNGCNLPTPGALSSEVDRNTVDIYLPVHLQYACQYWVGHTQRGNVHICDNGQIHGFLQSHFLHWLEALSLMGKISEGVLMVMNLESVLTPAKQPYLFAFVYDARRFILKNRQIIEIAPLQIYTSALIFSPEKSVIRRQFLDPAPIWLKNLPIAEENWSSSLQALEGHSGYVGTVVFSPDGKLVASGSEDGTVRLWDTITGKAHHTLKGHLREVGTVIFSPNGQLVASGSYDNTVRLWDVTTGAAYGTLEGHSGMDSSVVFSPDGQLVASGLNDGTIRLWDVTTGVARGTFTGHSSSIWTVAFSPDGHLIASGSADDTVRLWDISTGAPRYILKGHSSLVSTVVFSPDGQLIASGSADGTVRLWDTITGTARGIPEDYADEVSTVAFSPDGQLVAYGLDDGPVRLLNAITGVTRGILEGYSGGIKTVAFSPDGQFIVSGSRDSTVRLWAVTTRTLRGTLKGHSDGILTVVFSPDSQLIASGSYDGTVRLWDATTRVTRGIFEGHSDQVKTVVFSPDGQLVASGSHDGTIGLWDATTGAARCILKGHSSRVDTVVFSPDGQLFASGSADGRVRLCDMRRKTVHHVEDVYSGQALLFSDDGLRLEMGQRQMEINKSASPSVRLSFNPSYSLDLTTRWVTWKDSNVLWLPSDRRPGIFTIRDGIIVLGNGTGRVTFLHLDIGIAPSLL